MSFLSRERIFSLGFSSVGDNVQISEFARFYNCTQISLGNNVRIDDFCVLSAGAGGIAIGDYVHIAAHSLLVGASKITLSDFSGLSARVSVFSSSDDYSGSAMTNPTIPCQFTKVKHADVFLGKHVIIGCGSVLLPGTHLEEGVAIGALSVAARRYKEYGIYSGNPARLIKPRERRLQELEIEFLGIQ